MIYTQEVETKQYFSSKVIKEKNYSILTKINKFSGQFNRNK